MKIAIVANGTLSKTNYIKAELARADIIICADGGANKISKLGIAPNYVIGDLDSLSKDFVAKLKRKVEVIQDSDQDSTDLEKAIALAEKLRPNEITILGAIGDNLDHTISNVYCLDRISPKIKARIIDDKNEVFLVKDSIELKGKKGDTISIIPISEVKGLSYQGLKWGVNNKNVSPTWFGTRNLMLGSKCKISLKSGKVLVIKIRGGE